MVILAVSLPSPLMTELPNGQMIIWPLQLYDGHVLGHSSSALVIWKGCQV